MWCGSKTFVWSATALISMSAWRATTMLMSDISAEWAEDALDGYAGAAGHWLILVIVMLGYAIHSCRCRRQRRVLDGVSPRNRRCGRRGRSPRAAAQRLAELPRWTRRSRGCRLQRLLK